MSLTRWKDRSFLPMGSFFESFFKEGAGEAAPWQGEWVVPAVNVTEDYSNFVVEVAAPGLSKEDFTIRVEQDQLVIQAEKKEEHASEEKSYTRREYNFSSFIRSMFLPDNAEADRIKATYDKGILSIVVPKKENEQVSVKNIQVS